MLVYYLNEEFKACWFTTLMKDSRHAGLLPYMKDSRHAGLLP